MASNSVSKLDLFKGCLTVLGLVASQSALSVSIVNLGTVSGRDGESANPSDVSNNGIVVGTNNVPSTETNVSEAFRWTADKGMQSLGNPDPSILRNRTRAGAHLISGDGSVIIASSSSDMFAWSEDSKFTLLPDFILNVMDFSTDGTILAGNAKRSSGIGRGYLYRLGETDPELIIPNNSIWSMSSNAQYYSTLSSPHTLYGGQDAVSSTVNITAISNAGTAFGYDPKTNHAALWSPEVGQQTVLNERSRFIDVSADGSIGLVRNYTEFSSIWSQTNGVQKINEYLGGMGLDVSDWASLRVQAISDNGRYITGNGNYKGEIGSAFLIDLARNDSSSKPPASVPEPGTIAIFSLGLAGLFFRRKMR